MCGIVGYVAFGSRLRLSCLTVCQSWSAVDMTLAGIAVMNGAMVSKLSKKKKGRLQKLSDMIERR